MSVVRVETARNQLEAFPPGFVYNTTFQATAFFVEYNQMCLV